MQMLANVDCVIMGFWSYVVGWPSTNFDGQVVISVGVVSATDYVLVMGKPCWIGDFEAILVLNATRSVWANVVSVLVFAISMLVIITSAEVGNGNVVIGVRHALRLEGACIVILAWEVVWFVGALLVCIMARFVATLVFGRGPLCWWRVCVMLQCVYFVHASPCKLSLVAHVVFL